MFSIVPKKYIILYFIIPVLFLVISLSLSLRDVASDLFTEFLIASKLMPGPEVFYSNDGTAIGYSYSYPHALLNNLLIGLFVVFGFCWLVVGKYKNRFSSTFLYHALRAFFASPYISGLLLMLSAPFVLMWVGFMLS